jgi:hypothetical protein
MEEIQMASVLLDEATRHAVVRIRARTGYRPRMLRRWVFVWYVFYFGMFGSMPLAHRNEIVIVKFHLRQYLGIVFWLAKTLWVYDNIIPARNAEIQGL